MVETKSCSRGSDLALAALVLTALGLTLYGGKLAEYIGTHAGLSNVFVTAWKIAQWPVTISFMFVAFAVTYYFGPNLEKPEWHFITPGAVLGLIFWIVASFGFKIYLQFFNSYSKTYGSLGAAIILLLWLYITGFAILVGGEVNSVIGRAAEAQQQREKRLKTIEQQWRAA